ncbi:MAG: shikimate dehydrogenase [Bacteroidota bacterium]
MKLYGLIGYPLGHSFSKQYFTEKFEREKIADCSFEAFPIESINGFPSLLKNNPSLKGLSVTIPYKEQVLQFIDEISDEVKAIGATNSIKVSNGKLTAYNTDIVGFEKSFVKLLKPHHTKALVLGTGGASKAVQFVLNKLKIDFLVVTRKKQNDNQITYEEIDEAVMKNYPVIINCSPVGMYPNDNIAPAIPYQFISADHYLYDLVYKPAETLFLKNGKERGAVLENGYEMLLLQAEESWRIWNND